MDTDEFTSQWIAYGREKGGKHQVFQKDDVFYKRNNLAFYTSYLEYFERLVIHNYLLLYTLYRFEGLMLMQELGDEYPQLRPVVSQKALRGVRGATRDEVESLMNQLGLVRWYEDNWFIT